MKWRKSFGVNGTFHLHKKYYNIINKKFFGKVVWFKTLLLELIIVIIACNFSFSCVSDVFLLKRLFSEGSQF